MFPNYFLVILTDNISDPMFDPVYDVPRKRKYVIGKEGD